MILIQNEIPRKVTLACSGGVDSVAVLDFLSKNHEIDLLFVHHLTETSDIAEDFVDSIASKYGIDFTSCYIDENKPKGVSLEEHWRNERYKVFHENKNPVITCHHLDDVVETWIWSSLHGEGKLIPYANENVIRPFLTTRKKDFTNWAIKRSLTWVEDASNLDTKYMRNHIRHNMMPDILKVNPGIHKIIRKKLIERETED